MRGCVPPPSSPMHPVDPPTSVQDLTSAPYQGRASTTRRGSGRSPTPKKLSLPDAGESQVVTARVGSASPPLPLCRAAAREKERGRTTRSYGDLRCFLRPHDLEQGRETPLQAASSPSRPHESHRKTELTPSTVPHALRPLDRSDEIQSGGLPIADPPQRLLFTR